MNDKTRADIDAANDANAEMACIQLAAAAKSPHGDNYIHNCNPCIQTWLVENREWTVARTSLGQEEVKN